MGTVSARAAVGKETQTQKKKRRRGRAGNEKKL